MSTTASAAAGPSISATTTARLSATTSLGCTIISWSYNARICDQSVSSASRRVRVHGRDRGLDLVRTGLVAPQARAHQVLSLGDELAIPQRAVLVGEQHERCRPAATRAGRRASVSSSSASSPDHLGLVGHELGEQARQSHGLRAQVGPHQSDAPLLAVWPSL